MLNTTLSRHRLMNLQNCRFFSHGRLRGLKISNSFNPDSVLIFVRRDRHLIKDGLIFVMIDVADNLNLSLFIFINEESFDRHH